MLRGMRDTYGRHLFFEYRNKLLQNYYYAINTHKHVNNKSQSNNVSFKTQTFNTYAYVDWALENESK